MRTTLNLAFFSLGLVAALSVATAQGKPGNQGAMTAPSAGAPTTAPSAPALSPDQQKKIEGFREAAIAKAAPVRGQIHAKIAEIRQLFLAEKPDRQAILAKQAELEPMQKNLREIWTDFALQVHGVLSPQQRIAWAESGWGMHMGMGMGMGMGPGMGKGHRGGRGQGGGMMMGPGAGTEPGAGLCPFGCPMCPGQQQ